MITIHFLGTGTSQGIPVVGSTQPVSFSSNNKDKRLRTSVWIYADNFSIIIDCGPDFRQQMLQSGCKQIDAILFTHEHADHTAGIDDIRPFNFRNGVFPVFAHKRVIKNLKKRFDYIFETQNKYPGAPSVIVNEVIDNQNFMIKNKTIIPLNAWHGKLQVFGYRIDNFAYLTDIKTIDNSEIEKIIGIELLVINALRDETHHSHFNLQEALDFISLVNPKTAYLTHISEHFGFHETIQERLPNNVFVAYDGLQLEIK